MPWRRRWRVFRPPLRHAFHADGRGLVLRRVIRQRCRPNRKEKRFQRERRRRKEKGRSTWDQHRQIRPFKTCQASGRRNRCHTATAGWWFFLTRWYHGIPPVTITFVFAFTHGKRGRGVLYWFHRFPWYPTLLCDVPLLLDERGANILWNLPSFHFQRRGHFFGLWCWWLFSLLSSGYGKG